jgi:hypothetical protein
MLLQADPHPDDKILARGLPRLMTSIFQKGHILFEEMVAYLIPIRHPKITIDRTLFTKLVSSRLLKQFFPCK